MLADFAEPTRCRAAQRRRRARDRLHRRGRAALDRGLRRGQGRRASPSVFDPAPRILVEPGRSLVGNAGVTAYRVGTVKEIPGVRTYVAVDGGMSDNLRPMLYGSRYEALIADRAGEAPDTLATIAGMHCESGDVLSATRARRAAPSATSSSRPPTGAYGHAMANNYNGVPRPPVIFCRDGEARVVVRRETWDDLLARDESMALDDAESASACSAGAPSAAPSRSCSSERADMVEEVDRAAPGGHRRAHAAARATSTRSSSAPTSIVELIGGTDPARDYVTRALRAGSHVVTANKQLSPSTATSSSPRRERAAPSFASRPRSPARSR